MQETKGFFHCSPSNGSLAKGIGLGPYGNHTIVPRHCGPCGSPLHQAGLDEKVCGRDSQHFDTDSSVMVCDNSANVHVCNQKSMFIGEISPVTSHSVATIGGKGHAPGGTGTVRWS